MIVQPPSLLEGPEAVDSALAYVGSNHQHEFSRSNWRLFLQQDSAASAYAADMIRKGQAVLLGAAEHHIRSNGLEMQRAHALGFGPQPPYIRPPKAGDLIAALRSDYRRPAYLMDVGYLTWWRCVFCEASVSWKFSPEAAVRALDKTYRPLWATIPKDTRTFGPVVDLPDSPPLNICARCPRLCDDCGAELCQGQKLTSHAVNTLVESRLCEPCMRTMLVNIRPRQFTRAVRAAFRQSAKNRLFLDEES